MAQLILLELLDEAWLAFTLFIVSRLVANVISMCLLLCGGINLMKIKRTLVNLSRSGSLMTMIPVDQLSLCLCSELHKGMLPVQQKWMDAKN